MHVISTTDLLPPEWRFLADQEGAEAMTWATCSGQPRNGLERLIRRPALARWRAGFQAARAARKRGDALLVSHLPMMGAVTNLMRQRFCPDVPQLGFAFNFTTLPRGARLAFLRRNLPGIAEFVVFSRMERALYADLFGLPEDRFHFLPWTMEPPRPGSANPLPADVVARGYLCAVGGEGRDYGLLARAMRARPDLHMAVVGRPYSLAGIDFPANVTVFTNLALEKTWALAAGARGMVIPLATDTTPCGHVTLIGSQLLGLPLVISASQGVADYVGPETAHLVPVGDAEALVAGLDLLAGGDLAALGARARVKARAENHPRVWLDHLRDAGRRFGL